MLKVDLKDLRKLERHLGTMRDKALPYATRQTINDQAFKAQMEWRKSLPERLTLRSKYTEQSVQVDKATSLDIQKQRAVVGSIADYMDEQEHGATLPTATITCVDRIHNA